MQSRDALFQKMVKEGLKEDYFNQHYVHYANCPLCT
jgi:hypothetical protein